MRGEIEKEGRKKKVRKGEIAEEEEKEIWEFRGLNPP